MVKIVDRLLFVRRVPIFKELRDMDEIMVPANYTIFRQGEEGRSFFIVVSGRVKIHIEDREIAIISPGEPFGDMAVFDAQTRSASATTLEPSQCLELTQEQLYEAIEETPEIAINIIRVFSRRIREQNNNPTLNQE
jgi:CRP/FNR family transcriptional regulator, cyclic AMP receptor protein